MSLNLQISEEESLLRDTAQAFFADHMPVTHLRKLRDSGDELAYNPELWREMAKLGWPGILVPEKFGGSDYGLTGMGLILEESGRFLSPSPLLSTAVIGASLLSAAAAEDSLQALLAGELVTALALDEQGWHDLDNLNCQAEKTSNGYRLTGDKRFVADGIGADVYLVVARTGGGSDRLSVFAVPAGSKGLQVQALKTVDSRNAADLKLQGVEVAADALLGDEGNGMALLEPVLDMARACLAAEMLGSAQEVFDLTLEYLRERRQFNAPIGSFQALQHRAADLYCHLELTRSSVLAALAAHRDKPEEFARLASLAKAHAGKTLNRTSLEGVQMHGGIGVTDEMDLGLYLKRARVAEQMLGDSDMHSKRYATLSGF